jgi:hypothetical protein
MCPSNNPGRTFNTMKDRTEQKPGQKGSLTAPPRGNTTIPADLDPNIMSIDGDTIPKSPPPPPLLRQALKRKRGKPTGRDWRTDPQPVRARQTARQADPESYVRRIEEQREEDENNRVWDDFLHGRPLPEDIRRKCEIVQQKHHANRIARAAREATRSDAELPTK